ncbi:MAG: hypothetical protein QF742_08830 [Alphaproteobacteria bacterium]|nr:hypothetical protein [Alphaproteobacteria bacterium]MDP7486547.1 hypothetical protein [Alphaproteobacteria bacterium]
MTMNGCGRIVGSASGVPAQEHEHVVHVGVGRPHGLLVELITTRLVLAKINASFDAMGRSS